MKSKILVLLERIKKKKKKMKKEKKKKRERKFRFKALSIFNLSNKLIGFINSPES